MAPATKNQNPEQIARDQIDTKLADAGWCVQSKDKINFNAGRGIAVREYKTDIGPADYALFIDHMAVGVVEAKAEDWGHKITTVEEQSGGYAAAKLKWVKNSEPLPFVYESTGIITRFTDGRDPKPRSREVFTFHRPETMAEWLSNPNRSAPACMISRVSIPPASAIAKSRLSKTSKSRSRPIIPAL
ncbi:MAG: hypothetical protein P4L10_12875 [Acidobacteriaceae bacterium]|nr:hypothetical protein [Acidobacteriaceae bacterium]